MTEPIKQNQSHLPWLDGLRGGAAVWVLLSHVQILSGLHSVPILSWGNLAVDLFMMLSGFLMAHHYIERRNAEPWNSKKTIGLFWIRRFFRIAPLFYFLLIIAFLIGPWLNECRNAIAAVWPTTATTPERYTDNSLLNFLTHITFIFGFLPSFSFRSPLPDWSIGLEMQFYLFFPLIMLLFSTLGALRTTLLLLITCLAMRFFFHDFMRAFPMPSFLPLKLYVFMIGIWIAVSRSQGSMKTGFLIAMAISGLWLLIERDQSAVARIFLIIAMFYLMDNGTMPFSLAFRKVIEFTRRVLSNRISRFLGDTSYSSYLLHLLIVLPIAAWLVGFNQYLALSGGLRFLTCLVLCLPLIYLGSWLLYNVLEIKGIALGKHFLSVIKNKRN